MMRALALMLLMVGAAHAQEAAVGPSPVTEDVSSSRFEGLRTEVEGQLNASRVQVQQMLSCHAKTLFWNGSSCVAPSAAPEVYSGIDSVVETTTAVSPDTCSQSCVCDTRNYDKTVCNVRRITSCSEFSLKPDVRMSGTTLNVTWKSCTGASDEILPYRIRPASCSSSCTP